VSSLDRVLVALAGVLLRDDSAPRLEPGFNKLMTGVAMSHALSRQDPQKARALRDHLRKLAGAPVTPIVLSSSAKSGRWRLNESNKQVSAWSEEDAPGLAAWLFNLLHRHDAAWEMAQEALAAVLQRQGAGRESGTKRRGAKSKRAKIIDYVELLVSKEFDPFLSIPDIAKKSGCKERYARRVLNAIISRH